MTLLPQRIRRRDQSHLQRRPPPPDWDELKRMVPQVDPRMGLHLAADDQFDIIVFRDLLQPRCRVHRIADGGEDRAVPYPISPRITVPE